MNLKSIILVPLFEIEFTRAEVDALIEGATSHYDRRCRSTAERSEGPRIWPEEGLLVGLRNGFEVEGRQVVSRAFEFSEIDLLGKIAESPMVSREIHASLMALLRRFNEESEKANAKAEGKAP